MTRGQASLLLLLLALSSAAGAEELRLALEASREETELRYAEGPARDTRITRVAATLRETSRPGFQPGLVAGGVWLRQDGEPATEGLGLDGVFAGALVRSRLPVAGGLALIGAGSWIWHDVEDSDAGRSVTLEWAELEGRAGLELAAGGWTLSGGVLARNVDGDLRVEGESTRAVDAAEGTGGWAELAVALDRTGTLVFHGEAGARNRIGVGVARRF